MSSDKYRVDEETMAGKKGADTSSAHASAAAAAASVNDSSPEQIEGQQTQSTVRIHMNEEAKQTHGIMPTRKLKERVAAPSPLAAGTSSSHLAAPASSSSPSPPSPGAANVVSPRRKLTNGGGGSHAVTSVATLQSQITPACHVVPADKDSGNDGNVFVHVIDGTGQFSCTPVDLTYLVLHAQQSRNSSYSVVGIMGCQSTGKSTLLNLLFGTKFQEMDSSQGRSQTTKGVWMDSGCRKRDLVIMDLEGTDSGERGEDRTTFERQTSLYALAVAEVLLINMWEHDIGRYTASNYGILKTVFEVNLQLEVSQEALNLNRTVLMFVIRDHIEEETPMEQLQSKLHKEVDKIWGEIRKPDRFKETQVKDLFEIKFVALPHMKLQKELFKSRVGSLREQFVSPSNPDYLFGHRDGRKAVPADGFGLYMEQCWATIRSNKELNLPTQKEMLATFRCDEIIHSLYADTFTPGLSELKEAAATELVSDAFADTAEPLLRSILADYSDETKHYHASIVASKKRELLRKMSRELEEIFATQARKFVTKQALDVCKQQLKTQLASGSAAVLAANAVAASSGSKRGSVSASAAALSAASHDAPHPAFAVATQSAVQAAMEFATTELAKFQLPVLSETNGAEGAEEAAGASGGSSPASTTSASSLGGESGVGADPLLSWSALSSKVEEEVRTAVEGCVALERSHQLKKLTFHLDKVFKAQLSSPLTSILKKASPKSMWSDVGKLYRKVRQNVVQQYVVDTLAVAYACSAEETASLVEQSEQQLTQLCRLIVDQHTGMISLHLRSKFDSLFRYDKEGRIRKWGARDNIRTVFKHARDETLQLLDLFAIFRLDEYKDADSPANKKDQAAREEEEAAKTKPATLRRASTFRTSNNTTSSAPSSGSSNSSSGAASPSSHARSLSSVGETKGEDGSSSSEDPDEAAGSEDEDDEGVEEKVGRSTIDYSAVDPADIILDAATRLEKESTFRFDIEGALREAELQQAANEEKTKIPMWIVPLIIFLGWDEFMSVLRNPFLLVFLVLVGGGAYAAHQVGALFPMIAVAKATALQFIAQAQGSINNAAAAQQQPPTRTVGRRLSSMPAGVNRRASHIRNPSLEDYTESESTPRSSSRRGSTIDGLSRRRAAAAASDNADEQVEMAELSASPIETDEVQFHLGDSRSSLNATAAAPAFKRANSGITQKRTSISKQQ